MAGLTNICAMAGLKWCYVFDSFLKDLWTKLAHFCFQFQPAEQYPVAEQQPADERQPAEASKSKSDVRVTEDIVIH